MSSVLYWGRWVICLPVGFFFVICVIGNWGILLRGLYSLIMKRGEYSSSFCLPFAGPLLGIMFFLIIPIEGVNQFWWTAPMLEPMWFIGIYMLIMLPFTKK